MLVNELDQMLSASATEVMETMFFTCLGEEFEAAHAPMSSSISASMTFRGHPSGRFGVRVSSETGRNIAASFLGLEMDAICESQVGEVVCELTNMVCGSVLSHVESESHFELLQPELGPHAATVHADGRTACRSFEMEEGIFTVWLELDEGHDPDNGDA